MLHRGSPRFFSVVWCECKSPGDETASPDRDRFPFPAPHRASCELDFSPRTQKMICRDSARSCTTPERQNAPATPGRIGNERAFPIMREAAMYHPMEGVPWIILHLFAFGQQNFGRGQYIRDPFREGAQSSLLIHSQGASVHEVLNMLSSISHSGVGVQRSIQRGLEEIGAATEAHCFMLLLSLHQRPI